jgi:hypothetical protein
VAFHWSLAPWERETSAHGSLVLEESLKKVLEFPTAVVAHARTPGVEFDAAPFTCAAAKGLYLGISAGDFRIGGQ